MLLNIIRLQENRRILHYQEGYGQLVNRFFEGSRLELPFMNEKVETLKRYINRLTEELVKTENAKQNLLDSQEMFRCHTYRVLADMPKIDDEDEDDQNEDQSGVCGSVSNHLLSLLS